MGVNIYFSKIYKDIFWQNWLWILTINYMDIFNLLIFLFISFLFFSSIKYSYNLLCFSLIYILSYLFPSILNGEENPREFDWWTCAFKIAINAKYMILTRGRCQGKMVTTQIVIFYVRNTWKIWLYNAVIILLLFIACIMSVFITMLGKREIKELWWRLDYTWKMKVFNCL